MSGNVNFVGTRQGTIENVVDTHSDQTISGQKTITNLSGTTAHITTRLQVGGVHNTNHAVNVNGVISGSGNISGSAFYANGVLLEAGGGISFDGSTANGVLTFKDSDEATVESKLKFDGSVLDFTDTSISGSGNISGSQFYGAWAGSNILGSQIQLASAKGIQDDSGLALNVAGLDSATPAGGNTVVIDQGSGAKRCTVTNLMALAPVSDASALGNSGRVLLDGGVGTISTNANLSFGGTPITLTVNGQISASSGLYAAGHITSSGDLAVSGNVSASAIQIEQYITHAGDPDSFFGFGIDDNIAFVAGGVQMLTNYGNLSPKRVQVGGSDFRVNSSGLDFQINNSDGFVGIGDTSPTVPLEISSSNDPQFKIVYHGSNAASFKVASNGNLTISSNGTTTVDTALLVNGNTTLGDASGDILTINGFGVTAPNGLNFDSNTLVVSSSNNRVGVGTSSPISELDVSGKIAITAESTTPAQPLDGQGFIYSKNDGKLYWRSFDLAETNLTTTSADIGTTTIKTAFLSSAPSFSGGDTNEFFIKWSDGTTVSQPDLRSNNQYFLFPGGGFLSKVTAFGSSTTDSSDSNPFTNDLRIKVYVWDANDTSDIAEGNFATGYVAVASVSGSATDVKTTDSGGSNRYHRASYNINVNHQISASVGIAVSVQGVDAGNNNSRGFNALNLSFHFTDI
jgi:hypothetical protein